MDIKNWSNNAAVPPTVTPVTPHFTPEGNTSIASINNVIRELYAAIRRFYEAHEWRDFGHTTAFVDTTHFSVSPGGSGTMYALDQRIRVSDGSGIVYTTITGIATDVIETADTLTAPVSAVAVGPDPTGLSISPKAVFNIVEKVVPGTPNSIALLTAGGTLGDSGGLLSTDNTMGGATPLDTRFSSQKAVRDHYDPIIAAALQSSPQVLFRTPRVTMASTAAETNVVNVTVPADALKIGSSYVRHLHVKAAVKLRSTGVGYDATIKAQIGSTVIGRLTKTVAASATRFQMVTFDLLIIPVTQNTQKASLIMHADNILEAETQAIDGAPDTGITGNSAVAEDLATALGLVVTCQMSASSASNTVDWFGATVRVI